VRPNFLQREHRHIVISPQFGHGNFVVSVPGAIILWHDVHVGTVIVDDVAFSVMVIMPSFDVLDWICSVGLAYMCCVVYLVPLRSWPT